MLRDIIQAMNSVVSTRGRRDIEVVMGFRLCYVFGFAIALSHLAKVLIGQVNTFNFQLVLAAGLLIVGVLGEQLYGGWAARKEEQRIRARLLQAIFQQYRQGKASPLTGPQLGRTVSLLTDSVERLTEYRQVYWGATKAALATPILVLTYIAVMIDPVIGLSQIGLFLLIPVCLAVFMRLFRKTSAKSRQERARLSAKYLDAIRNLTTIRLLGAGPQVEADLAAEGERNRVAIMRLLASNQVVIILIDGLFALLLLVANAGLLVWRQASGAVTGDAAIEIFTLVVLLLEPLSQVSGFFYIGMGGKAAERVIGAKLTGHGPSREKVIQSRHRTTSDKLIELVNVDLDYGRGPVLTGINLTIKSGDRIGIIGASGTGKSSLLKIIRGQLAPNSGIIDTCPEQIATVEQHTWLFSGTIRDNLQLVSPQAGEEEIWRALEKAHLATEVRQMPKQLDTELGEQGARISGGQAQRLSLARAFLSGRKILVLDEPTSQIDQPSQAKLLMALAELGSEYTIILVSHRTALLKIVNRCYQVKNNQLQAVAVNVDKSANEPANYLVGKTNYSVKETTVYSGSGSVEKTVNEPAKDSAKGAAQQSVSEVVLGCRPGFLPETAQGCTLGPAKQNGKDVNKPNRQPEPNPIKTWSLVRWLLAITRPVHGPLAWSVGFRILSQLFDIALFALLGGGTYGVIIGRFPLGYVFIGLFLLAIGKATTHYLEQFSGHYVAFKALELLRTAAFKQLWPKAPAVLQQTQSGDLLTSITRDIDRIEVFYAHTIAPLITAVVTPVLVGTIVWWYGESLLIFVPLVALLLSLLLVPMLGSKLALATTAQTLKTRRQLAQQVTDSIGGIVEVTGYSLQDKRQQQMYQLGEKITNSSFRVRLVTATRRIINLFLLFLSLFWVASVLPMPLSSSGSAGILTLALIGVTLRVFQAPFAVEDAFSYLDNSFAAARRLWEISHLPSIVNDGPQTAKFSTAPTVSWQEVSFSYPEFTGVNSCQSVSTLEKISLIAPGGKRTVILGVSGSGKSTLVKMLLRFFDPTYGQVCLDQQPVSAFTLDSLRQTVGYVAQNQQLLAGTIADNLRLGAAEASENDVWKVLEVVQLAQEIREMPHKLTTFVGEQGNQLSGGQRQRLALAQVLLRCPQVLVLDEFTASLDARTAQLVRIQLAQHYPKLTVIEITHRLESLLAADQIVLLEQGKIVAQGPAAEVMRQGPIADFVQAQV